MLKRNQVSQSSKSSASLKLLSDTEKLQLLQLQKTRDKIAQELKKYPGVDMSSSYGFENDDPFGVSFSIPSTAEPGYRTLSTAGRASRSRNGRSAGGSRPGSTATVNNYIESIRTGIDMVPVMATSGQFAMGGGSAAAKGKIKLPIFKLPAIDTSRVKSREQNKHLEKALQSGGESFEQRYIPYHDIAGYRKALVLMMKSFGRRDAEIIKYFLRMNSADFEDLENELRKKYEPKIRKLATKSSRNFVRLGSIDSNTSGSVGSEKDLAYLFQQEANAASESIVDTLFREDAVMSVFALAKDVVVLAKQEQVSEALGDQTDAIVYNKALRSITSKMDMSALGLSDSMTEYLTMGSIGASPAPARGTQGFEKLKTNINTALGGFASALATSQAAQTQLMPVETEASASVRKIGSMPSLYSLHPKPEPTAAQGLASAYGRQQHQTRAAKDNKKKKSMRMPPIHNMSQTNGFFPQSSVFGGQNQSLRHTASSHQLGISEYASSADLTSALVSSLRTMQKHSNMIKESISSAQSVINIADPKAKGLVFSVAAESLRKALQPLLVYELRRGFTAWNFVVRQERRQEKAGVFIHFCTVRNTLLALDEIVKRVLRNKVARWKDYTFFETQRIKKERMLQAVLKIQGIFRARTARRKVEILRQRRKYQKLYDSTIKIQALFRGKLGRWTYLRETRDKRQNDGARRMQSILRGYLARKRVYIMRLRRNKALAATNIQKIVRSRIASKRVQLLLKDKRHGFAATVIQCCIRGFLGRKHIARILIDIARYKYAVRIQAMVRGALGRIHLVKKIAAMEQYRSHRNKAATMIQSAYRGYRCSVLYKMMMYKVNKTKKEEARAATAITRIVRGFVSRAYLRELRRIQRVEWIADARHFKETWADDSESWFYYNEATGEALWEPSALGYTKSDGYLVLANGEIIEDPLLAKKEYEYAGEAGEEEDEEEVKAVVPDRKRNAKLCSECADRTATRGCNECGDKFCTKCYKYMHSTGTRRSHTFTALGPIDCTECELRLAERWCVSCDEAYCDGCWRKVHSKGKRVFHPYSEVSPEGRIDARIYTMDGDQLSDYDSAYAQQRVDVNAYNTKQEGLQLQIEAQQQQQYAGDGYNTEGYNESYGGGYDYASPDESTVAIYDDGTGYADYNNYDSTYDSTVAEYAYPAWEQYYDDDGNAYWYDPATGASQYENPYG